MKYFPPSKGYRPSEIYPQGLGGVRSACAGYVPVDFRPPLAGEFILSRQLGVIRASGNYPLDSPRHTWEGVWE